MNRSVYNQTLFHTTCASTINPTVLTQSSSKGICGSLTAGATAVAIYKMDATGNTLMNPGSSNTTYGAGTFSWFSCGGGASNVTNGTYMVILTGSGCQSTPVFDCISSGSSSLSGLTASTGITFPTVIYPFHTSITGAVPTFQRRANSYVVYQQCAENNSEHTGQYNQPIHFSALQLKAGDNIKIYLSGNSCTVYNSTTVTCYNQPPVITTDANGVLLAGATTISGICGSQRQHYTE